jgi:hypothetical protein
MEEFMDTTKLVQGLKCCFYVLNGVAKGLAQFPAIAANKVLTTAQSVLDWCQKEFSL